MVTISNNSLSITLPNQKDNYCYLLESLLIVCQEAATSENIDAVVGNSISNVLGIAKAMLPNEAQTKEMFKISKSVAANVKD